MKISCLKVLWIQIVIGIQTLVTKILQIMWYSFLKFNDTDIEQRIFFSEEK